MMMKIAATVNEAYEKLRAHPDLPSPTGVALAILELAESEDCDIRELARIVESDPAIASRMLKLVNSPFMGVAECVASLPQALALLGLRNVKRISIGVSLLDGHKNGRCEHFNYDAFWSESLARAVAGCNLAWLVRGFDPNEVFAYGLLSQIGRLVFAQVYPERYDGLLASMHSEERGELVELEQALFGIDHNEVTARLIADWRLPEIAYRPIRWQDDPSASGAEPGSQTDRLTQTLHLCGLVARLLTDPEIQCELPSRVIRKARGLGFQPEVFHHAFDRTREEWREASQVFDVSSRLVPSLAEIYALAKQLREAMAWQSTAPGHHCGHKGVNK
ncbi:MAG: HDOD domain-containing protein [Planctomycetota bacterium]|jgi:HD-like signal output (HDOD) protein